MRLAPRALTRLLITLHALLLAFAILAATFPAQASGDCPTFLPDLASGCDRPARHANSVRPMSMPYLFEDPFITTEAQFVYIYHEFPDTSAFGGGDLNVLALQLRLAITERLAFIATKDGVGFFRPELERRDVGATPAGRPVLDDEDAFFDMTFGFKYALIDWRDKRFIFTPALRYEVPLGNQALFQGNGDGVFIPSGTAAWGSEDDRVHVIAGLGAQLPVDDDRNSSNLFYNFHVDYAWVPGSNTFFTALVPFVELNGITRTSDGRGGKNFETKLGNLDVDTIQAATGTGPFEGADVANIGSDGIAGKTVATFSVGLRMPINDQLSFGAAYERPMTDRKEIFEQRFTFMTTLAF